MAPPIASITFPHTSAGHSLDLASVPCLSSPQSNIICNRISRIPLSYLCTTSSPSPTLASCILPSHFLLSTDLLFDERISVTRLLRPLASFAGQRSLRTAEASAKQTEAQLYYLRHMPTLPSLSPARTRFSS